MCGIVVYVGDADPDAIAAPLEAAARAIRHRGPDDRGSLVYAPSHARVYRVDARGTRTPLPLPSGAARPSANVVLSHQRLSIIDLTAAAHQPMVSADGRHAVILNGEIYNYVELRRELAALGHAFRSRSDTEVLLAAFAAWGEGCLNRLSGMFAFALLDLERGRLFLARDPFGMKPLYYARAASGWVFASEIGALLELPGVGRRAEPAALFEYLATGVTGHGAATCFADVRAVPPAHAVHLDLGRLEAPRPVRYWRLPAAAREPRPTFADAAARLRELFLEGIALHLRSDVPVGTLLSGGTDSSSITMAMRRVGGPAMELHTFSYIGGQGAVSEERWIDVVNEASGAIVHKVHLEPRDWLSDIDRTVTSQGEPFGSIAVYAQYRLFRAAREAGVPVVLGGQGGDELMAGYRHHWTPRLASLLRAGSVAAAGGFLRQMARRRSDREPPTWRTAARALRQALPAAAFRWRRAAAPPWLDDDWRREHKLASRPPFRVDGPDVLRQTLRHGIEETLPILLRYEDRNSMAHSVEGRLPFLTRDLATFVLGLDEDHLVGRDASNKRVFREAMRGVVPDAILDRTDKVGFAVPVHTWPAQLPRIADALDGATRIPALSRDAVSRLAGTVRSGGTLGMRQAYVLWRIVGTALWAERFGVTFD